MFVVKSGNEILHDPTRQNPDRLLISPVLQMSVGSQGSLSFGISPEHPMYGSLNNRTTFLTVLDDVGEVWRGRVISQEKGWENIINIYAEGELAYLQDTRMRPFVFVGTRSRLLQVLIDNHNAQLTASDISIPTLNNPRKFTLDTANSDVDSDAITVTESNASSTWDLIDEYIIKRGYYPITYRSNGITYIKFVSDFPDGDQQIKFAENLLDLSYSRDSTEIYTKLLPLGATLDSSDPEYEEKPTATGTWHGNRRTIRRATAGDGTDILKSNVGRLIFGDIVGTKVYDDITDANALYAAASADLDKMISESVNITARAVDIGNINGTAPLRVGNYYTTFSQPHDLNIRLLCSSAEIHLTEPDQSEFEFGVGQKTLTDLNKK